MAGKKERAKHDLRTSIYSWNTSYYLDDKRDPKGNVRKKNLVKLTFVALCRGKHISEKLVFTVV